MRLLRAPLVTVLLLVTLIASACGTNETEEPAAPTVTTTTIPACEGEGRAYEFEGVRVHEFCGPARASVTVGEEALEFVSGRCGRHADWVEVNIGIEVVDPAHMDGPDTPRFRSFTLVVGAHPLAPEDALPASEDGNYHQGVITFTTRERAYVVQDRTVSLIGSRTAGLFTGSGLSNEVDAEPLPVEGIFTCDDDSYPLETLREEVIGGAGTNGQDETDELDSDGSGS